MKNFGKAVVKSRYVIFLLGLLLLIPAALGYFNTRVNYDILSYLPKDIETMQGQDILVDQFGVGGFSMVVLEGMDMKDVAELKEKFEGVDHVVNVIWYDRFLDISVPVELLPEKLKSVLNSDFTAETVRESLLYANLTFYESMDGVVYLIDRDICKNIGYYGNIALTKSLVMLDIANDNFNQFITRNPEAVTGTLILN